MNPKAAIQSVKERGQMPLVDYEKKNLFELAEAMQCLAAVEAIRRWAELSPEEAEIARELVEHMAAASEEIKSHLKDTTHVSDSALAEAARALKDVATKGVPHV